MKIKFTFLLLILSINILLAQYPVYPGMYAVYFKDKNGTKYTINQPHEFLTKRAIERREKFNIPITVQDLPVSSLYLDSLRRLGVKIKEISKWLNCAIIEIDTNDTTILQKLNNLDFIIPKPSYEYKKRKIKPDKKIKKIKTPNAPSDKYYYGLATEQVQQINVDKLHSIGYTGKGVLMAILDAGFLKVDKIPYFDTIWQNKQIKYWYDFVDNDTNVFDEGSHGLMVLSLIAANSKNFLGTAPDADFLLFRTENEHSEYQIEEYNYVCACEKADSLGADIIHSSLGYNNFDDTTTSYTYQDMDGNTAISTIGADIAASKGIIVTTSAGNEGDNSWKYITAPADADSVLTVGAVKSTGGYAYFSSEGPTYDGRIKPDVCADGYFDAVVGRSGKITFGAGTSFSGPLVAGGVACLRQALPNTTNMEIIHSLRATAKNKKKYDNKIGYGIADFWKAYWLLKKQ